MTKRTKRNGERPRVESSDYFKWDRIRGIFVIMNLDLRASSTAGVVLTAGVSTHIAW